MVTKTMGMTVLGEEGIVSSRFLGLVDVGHHLHVLLECLHCDI